MKNFSKTILLFLSLQTISSCKDTSNVQLCDTENGTCLTLITQDSIRYIQVGKQSNVTKQYLSINIGKIDPLADAIYICWLEDHKVEITFEGSYIIENKLNSKLITIQNSLPRDKRGIPTAKKFAADNCAVFDFHMMKLFSNDRIYQVLD